MSVDPQRTGPPDAAGPDGSAGHAAGASANTTACRPGREARLEPAREADTMPDPADGTE